MKLSLIAAVSKNGVIGRDGGLPWDRIPEDMALFRKLTMNKPVILGRKTWESLGGKPLDGRKNVVLSRKLWEHVAGPGFYVVRTTAEAIREAFDVEGVDEAFVIGGAEVYRQFAPICDEAHVTMVFRDVEGDATFPFSLLDGMRLVRLNRIADDVFHRHYVREVR